MTKRYLVFAGDHYYPSGGIQDLQASVDDLTDAIRIAEKDFRKAYDWVHIYDVIQGRTCWEEGEVIEC